MGSSMGYLKAHKPHPIETAKVSINGFELSLVQASSGGLLGLKNPIQHSSHQK